MTVRADHVGIAPALAKLLEHDNARHQDGGSDPGAGGQQVELAPIACELPFEHQSKRAATSRSEHRTEQQDRDGAADVAPATGRSTGQRGEAHASNDHAEQNPCDDEKHVSLP